MFSVHWVHLATGIPLRLAQIESRLSPAWTRRDDGLVLEDHSGGFRIEPLRPDGALVGFRPFEVRAEDARQRPGEVRQVELQEAVSMEATEPTACRVGNPRLVAATPYAGWL